MSKPVHSSPFRVWETSPDSAAKEAERLARERGAQLVRVIMSDDGEATIYRQNRMGLKHQELTPEELALMGDDRKAYFVAKWSNDEVRWNLLRKTTQSFT